MLTATHAYAGPTSAERTSVPPQPYLQSQDADQAYNVVILGDSLADGLYQGLTRLNKDNDAIRFVKKARVNTGIVRADRYDWNKAAEKLAKSGEYQIAIILLGLNDLQTFRENGKAHHYGTDGWIERYEDRIEQMMRTFKAANMAVYWASIPAVTTKHYQSDFIYLNTFYKSAAQKLGVRFVDTWTPLLDQDGAYSAYWKDDKGKTILIRGRDGVHFNADGYLILAGIVNDVLKKDIEAVQTKKAHKQ